MRGICHHASLQVPAVPEEVWRDKKQNYRFNAVCRAMWQGDYFSPTSSISRSCGKLLSYYPQLDDWMAELMGEDGEKLAPK